MMKLPYGLADFYSLITDGYVYVDRTARIRELEQMGRALLFIRPRRFGKSLWLQTLCNYYDLRRAGEHQRLFGHLAIGADPTPLAHSYFVLVWNFSAVAAEGNVEHIGERLAEYVNGTIEDFLTDYADHLPIRVKVERNPVLTLGHLLAAIRKTPHRLYLLVDEYDNFANEVMVRDAGIYQRLLHSDGPYRQLFKWVKLAMEGQGLERLFITGVAPLVMSDITSGLNICRDVYLDPRLNDLCGFREAEVRDLLVQLLAELDEEGRLPPEVTLESSLEMMRTWYNGYRFAPEAEEHVYNPTLTLHFLTKLQDQGEYPRNMLDPNLTADEDKLRYLAEIARGRKLIAHLVETTEPVQVSRIEERFTLADLLDLEAREESFLLSYLYYFGMLTLKGETRFRALELGVPNLVIRGLYVAQIRRLLALAPSGPVGEVKPSSWLMTHGDLRPLLSFVEEKVFPTLSNSDYVRMGEPALKMLFLALLFDDITYTIHSEPELERGYADLCLILRPDVRDSGLWDLLLEFKYCSLAQLGLSAEELRGLEPERLLELPPVVEALAAAGEQLRRYARTLRKRWPVGLRLRCYALVALGFERLVGQEIALE